MSLHSVSYSVLILCVVLCHVDTKPPGSMSMNRGPNNAGRGVGHGFGRVDHGMPDRGAGGRGLGRGGRRGGGERGHGPDKGSAEDKSESGITYPQGQSDVKLIEYY